MWALGLVKLTHTCFQGFTEKDGVVDVLAEVTGQDIMGAALKAPLATFDRIYTLPMLNIKEDKVLECHDLRSFCDLFKD